MSQPTRQIGIIVTHQFKCFFCHQFHIAYLFDTKIERHRNHAKCRKMRRENVDSGLWMEVATKSFTLRNVWWHRIIKHLANLKTITWNYKNGSSFQRDRNEQFRTVHCSLLRSEIKAENGFLNRNWVKVEMFKSDVRFRIPLFVLIYIISMTFLLLVWKYEVQPRPFNSYKMDFPSRVRFFANAGKCAYLESNFQLLLMTWFAELWILYDRIVSRLIALGKLVRDAW